VADAAHPTAIAPAAEERAAEAPLFLSVDPEAPATVSTGLGGVWYLINMLDALQLFGDDDGLNPWRLLATLARRLLGEGASGPDRLWDALAALAGVDGEAEPAGRYEQWLAQHEPGIHEWLQGHLSDPGLFPALLAVPATFHRSRTHIDVFFSIEQINLELRCAGLDRNPGWLAPLGRVISFYFL
jgi:hypothetical protein